MANLLIIIFLVCIPSVVLGVSQVDALYLQELYGFSVSNKQVVNNSNSDPSDESNDESCKQPQNFVEQLYGADFPKACKKVGGKSPEKYCSCLKEKISGNDLLSDLMSIEDKDTEDQKKLAKEKIKVKYTEQFKSAYEQMTFGESVQKHILGIPNEANVASCSPDVITELVKDQEKKYVQANIKFLEDKKKELEEKYENRCTSKLKRSFTLSGEVFCNGLKEKIEFLSRKLMPEEKEKISLEANKLINSVFCITDSDIDTKISELVPYKNLLEENPSLTEEDKKNLNELETIILKLKKAKTNQNMSFAPQFSKDKGCSISDMGSDLGFSRSDAVEKATDLILRLKESDRKTAASGEANPCEKDPVCSTFQDLNKNVSGEITKRFEENLPQQCVTFAEFSLLKGMPKSDFFSQMARSGDPVEFLKPDTKNPEKLNFLRSNPVLSKLIQHSETESTQTAFLNLALKNLSKKMSNSKLSEPQRLKIFIDFLKDDLSKFKPEAKSEKDSLICNDIARNFVIIQTAEYLSTENSDKFKDISPILAKEILQCDKKYDSVKPGNGLENLTVDPLFTLGVPNAAEALKSTEEDYKKFLDTNCKSNDGLSYQDYLSKNCKSSSDIAACRQQFLKDSPFSLINNVLQEEGVQAGTSNMSTGDLFHNVTSTPQSQQFWDWWKKDVMPGLNNDPTGLFGLLSYQQARSTEGRIFNGITPPTFSGTNIASTLTPSAPANVSKSDHQSTQINQKPISNPGQVQPRFNLPTQSNQAMATSQTSSRQPASVGTDSLRDNTNVRKPNIRPSSDDKWSSGTQSPQSTNSQDSKLGKADLDKLADDNSKLKDLNTSMAKKDSEVSSGNSQGSAVSGAVASSGSIAAGSQSSFSSGGGTRSVALGESPEKKGNFNDALNNIHEKSPMTVLGGVIDPGEFKGPQQSAKDLIVDDPKKFEKLGEDPALLEAFIKEKMKGMAIGESKIITIINASPNRPVPHMIFRIKAKADGSFDIQSVPSEVPVRVATLKSLIDQLPKR